MILYIRLLNIDTLEDRVLVSNGTFIYKLMNNVITKGKHLEFKPP